MDYLIIFNYTSIAWGLFNLIKLLRNKKIHFFKHKLSLDIIFLLINSGIIVIVHSNLSTPAPRHLPGIPTTTGLVCEIFFWQHKSGVASRKSRSIVAPRITTKDHLSTQKRLFNVPQRLVIPDLTHPKPYVSSPQNSCKSHTLSISISRSR